MRSSPSRRTSTRLACREPRHRKDTYFDRNRIGGCRAGLRVQSFTAAGLVSQQQKEQSQYTLDHVLRQLGRAHLLICDELGYVTISRGGVEPLFRVFVGRPGMGSSESTLGAGGREIRHWMIRPFTCADRQGLQFTVDQHRSRRQLTAGA